jgi:hypothetical protein
VLGELLHGIVSWFMAHITNGIAAVFVKLDACGDG